MIARTTEWRHRTGASQKKHPKGPVDYRAVALHICKRYYQDLLQNINEDLMQEIELLIIEAESRKRIRGITKNYGNGTDRMGLVSFSRACQARLHNIRKNYGMDRNKIFMSVD